MVVFNIKEAKKVGIYLTEWELSGPLNTKELVRFYLIDMVVRKAHSAVVVVISVNNVAREKFTRRRL